MPTLYDNFTRVKDFINENNSSYVSKTELANASYATSSDLNDYLPLSGGTLSGNLFAGDQEKTTVTFLGTKRKCGGESGTSYMASFFTNSDGRSKFAHKSYTGTKIDVSSDVDDAFMCFNAYGFKIAYSGEQGVAASTEYDLLHSGNIGNLGYVTHNYLDPHFSVGGWYSDDQVFIKGDGLSIRSWDVLELKSDTHEVYSYTLMPDNNNETLGNSDNPWSYTYTKNIILDGASKIAAGDGLEIYSGTDFIYLNNQTFVNETLCSSNISPQLTNTYTLGDETHLYSATYSARLKVGNNSQIYNDGGGITLSVNSNAGIRMGSVNFYPKNNNGMSLGQSSNAWNNTYTSNIYAGNLYLNDNNVLYNKTQYQVNLKLNGGDKYVFRTNHLSPASNGGSDLGQSDLHWNNAYINNVYISTSTYLPKNTYWYDGSSYHWLGSLFN